MGEFVCLLFAELFPMQFDKQHKNESLFPSWITDAEFLW